MIHGMVEGRIGKDAETRQVGDYSVTSFSVASSFYAGKGKGDEYNGRRSDYGTQWVDVSVWGPRGESLREKVRKGGLIVVVGELTTREHNGKTYLQCKAEHVRLMNAGGQGSGGSGSGQSNGGGYGGGDERPAQGVIPNDDDPPFLRPASIWDRE